MPNNRKPKRLAILVGGGPAPGINGVISAATIEAINCGVEVLGVLDGFKWLAKGDTKHVMPLTIEDVSRIHFQGGSVLRTSRENPTKSKEALENVVEALKALQVDYLITIGGDDTAYSASRVSDVGGGHLQVAHVPKTIDNDLMLPDNAPTFGFQTARHVGVGLVQNLMEDSRTTNRWYFVVAMGRKAGHLALGIGKAASATITIIGEEFSRTPITIKEICDILEAAMLKRRAKGATHGVAVLAEGLGELLDTEELESHEDVQIVYDEFGHIRLAEVPLSMILKREMEKRFHERSEKITIVEKEIGYELRCAPPIPFDCEYTRDLGYGAARYLVSDVGQHKKGAMVCLESGKLKPVPFDEMLDPVTKRTAVRLVDVNTESYAVARRYMIRLEREDFEDEELLNAMAHAGKMSVTDFAEKFGYLVGL